MKHSRMIFTDSGGIQKEAYILQKPCVTLRPETEWVETVQSGWNLLLPVFSRDFPFAVNNFKPPETHPALFGENVAEKIMLLLENK